MTVEDYAGLRVVNELPTAGRREGSDRFADDMVGATIVQIGTAEDPTLIEGGGLVIDYRPIGSKTVRRLVLGMTELGAWVAWSGIVTDEFTARVSGPP